MYPNLILSNNTHTSFKFFIAFLDFVIRFGAYYDQTHDWETETLIIYIDFSAGKNNMRISDLKLFSLSIIFDNLSRKLKYAFLIKITCTYFRRLLFALPLIQFKSNLVNRNF